MYKACHMLFKLI